MAPNQTVSLLVVEPWELSERLPTPVSGVTEGWIATGNDMALVVRLDSAILYLNDRWTHLLVSDRHSPGVLRARVASDGPVDLPGVPVTFLLVPESAGAAAIDIWAHKWRGGPAGVAVLSVLQS